MEREADELVVRWSGAPAGAEIPIFAGATPEGIERARPVTVLREGRARLEGVELPARPYLELALPGGERVVVAERRLPLEGTDNFRDLGGYATADGRRVRWGRLYRSGHLGELTDADVDYVAGLGIRLVCDLRGPGERERDPDRLRATDPPQVLVAAIADERADATSLEQAIRSGDLEGLDLPNLLVEGNRAFVRKFSDRYATLFAHLLDEKNLPALVHCTAGKDRAGLASALVLRSLGVPEETVLEDFLLTNYYTAARIERTLRMIRLVSFFRTDPEQVRPLLGVEPRYLQAAFDAIQEDWGDFDRYRREALGVDDAELRLLQASLLE